MTLDTVRTYCLSLPGTSEDMPFGDEVLVFRVMNKMFALMNIVKLPIGVNLKCDPERAVELREQYEGIQPGYHMNKQHWNTVTLAEVPSPLIRELIDHSYELIVQNLKKADREALGRG